MLNLADLDDRERAIYQDADSWWATRFKGRGVYDRLGPYDTALSALSAITTFFREEERHGPPTGDLFARPFALYAASSKHGGAHVIAGNIWRDGKERLTKTQSTKRQQEAKDLAKKLKSSDRRDPPGSSSV